MPEPSPYIMHQEAPYPEVLAKLVNQVRYRDNWTLRLEVIDRGQGSRGLTLIITARVQDSYHPERMLDVNHYMPVPPAAYDERSWRRWLFEQCQLVDRHEAMELFRIIHMADYVGQDGNRYDQVERPFAPSHGPGNDPYMIREVGTVEDQRTSFTGELHDH
jgi:hypothetical protein